MRTLSIVLFALSAGLLMGRAWGRVEIAWVEQHHPGSYYFADCNPGSPHDDDIGWLCEYPVAGGYGDGTFGPKDVVTREQMASFIMRQAYSDTLGAMWLCDEILHNGEYALWHYQNGYWTAAEYENHQKSIQWWYDLQDHMNPASSAGSQGSPKPVGIGFPRVPLVQRPGPQGAQR